MSRAGRALGVILLVIVVVSLLGGGLPWFTEDPDGEDLVAEVMASEGPETIVATRTQTMTVDPPAEPSSTTTHVDRVVQEPPDRYRTTVIETDHPGGTPGDVRAVDGDEGWYYFADREVVLAADDPPHDLLHYQGVEILDEYAVEYRGRETVDDRETHVVTIEPRANATAALSLFVADRRVDLATVDATDPHENGSVTTTWWIDADTPFPVKERIEIHEPAVESDDANGEDRTAEHADGDEDGLQRTVLTTTYEDVRFDEPIQEDRFRVDPPGWVPVLDDADSMYVRDPAHANETVPFPVPEPTVPDGFELAFANGHDRDDGATLRFVYERDGPTGGDVVTVAVTDGAGPFEYGEPIQDAVGEPNGTVVDLDRWITYVWHCDDVRYEVRVDVDSEGSDADGPDDEVDLAVTIGESMGCPS